MSGGGGGVIIIRALRESGKLTDKEQKHVDRIEERCNGGIATPRDGKALGRLAELVSRRA